MEGSEVENVVDGSSGHVDDLEDPLVRRARLSAVIPRKKNVAVGIDSRLAGNEEQVAFPAAP